MHEENISVIYTGGSKIMGRGIYKFVVSKVIGKRKNFKDKTFKLSRKSRDKVVRLATSPNWRNWLSPEQ
jgi:hypothetical protein